jgi:cytoskeletal protein RodZ
MESTRTSRGFVVAVLLVAVVALTALNVFQDHVINVQRYELRWLLTHSTIRPDTIRSDAAASAQNKNQQTPTTSVAQIPPATKPASPSASAAKP